MRRKRFVMYRLYMTFLQKRQLFNRNRVARDCDSIDASKIFFRIFRQIKIKFLVFVCIFVLCVFLISRNNIACQKKNSKKMWRVSFDIYLWKTMIEFKYRNVKINHLTWKNYLRIFDIFLSRFFFSNLYNINLK